MREAAARPVIVPDQVVIDHGKVFVSDTFVRACDRLGISVQPARKDTPTDKGVVEATFTAIKTLFGAARRRVQGREPDYVRPRHRSCLDPRSPRSGPRWCC